MKPISIVIVLASAVIMSVLNTPHAANGKQDLSQQAILSALFKHLDVKLSDAEYCNGVAFGEPNQTIGDYLSVFWAVHSDTRGKNWLEISATPIDAKTKLAKVVVYRKNGEENWGWGVSFKLDNAMKVNRASFTCLGAG